jgi:hypothetical protein
VWLKDFGNREGEGREALRIIRELRLTQYGTVGTPQPVMEYWLSYGQAPVGIPAGIRALPIDRASLRVEQIQKQWCLRDARRLLFAFGARSEEAHQALQITQRHGFTHVGFVGQPVPAMVFFLANRAGQSLAPVPTPAPFGPNALSPPNLPRPEPGPGGPAGPAVLEPIWPTPGASPPTGGGIGAGLVPAAQLPGAPPALVADHQGLSERVPFDWRQAQVRRENQDWKLMIGGYTLANFGANERDARQALTALNYYRFTEHCLVGRPAPSFSYFLCNGQAPRGLLVGLNAVPIRPEALTVQRLADGWAITEGSRPLFRFGEKAEDARLALQAIQRHKFDHLGQIGSSGPQALTILVRAR